MAHMLQLDDVHTYYGNIHALKGVSLEVERGEIVTLIGSNGAGKSTTLRTISAIQRPREGRVLFEDRELQQMPPHDVVKLGIAQAPEGRHVFARMSVYKNLQMGAFSRPGVSITADVARVYDLFPRLKERRTQKAGTLSGGEQQMLAIARALMAHPVLLLLDTPAAYLVLGLAAGGALAYRAWELWSVGYWPFPQQSPGIATAVVGVALMLYGAGRGFTVSRLG